MERNSLVTRERQVKKLLLLSKATQLSVINNIRSFLKRINIFMPYVKTGRKSMPLPEQTNMVIPILVKNGGMTLT